MFCALWKAFFGRFFWKSIVRRISNDWIILFLFSDEQNIARYLLLYLDRYLNQTNYKGAYIVTDSPELVELGCYSSNKIMGSKVVSIHTIDSFLQFYCLFKTDSRIIFGSARRPNGRHADRLLGKNGIDEKDIALIGVYGMKKLPKTISEQEDAQKA